MTPPAQITVTAKTGIGRGTAQTVMAAAVQPPQRPKVTKSVRTAATTPPITTRFSPAPKVQTATNQLAMADTQPSPPPEQPHPDSVKIPGGPKLTTRTPPGTIPKRRAISRSGRQIKAATQTTKLKMAVLWKKFRQKTRSAPPPREPRQSPQIAIRRITYGITGIETAQRKTAPRRPKPMGPLIQELRTTPVVGLLLGTGERQPVPMLTGRVLTQRPNPQTGG